MEMNFDLNINNYSRDELIEMFELPFNFDKNILDLKEIKLKDNIFNNKNINKDTQLNTLIFLSKAKNIILNDENSLQQNSLQQMKQEIYNSNYELKQTALVNPTEHDIQIRDNKPYLASFPSEFFPGVINPIKKRTIKKNLNIDTRFRDNYYATSSTNFNLNLPLKMDNILQMQLTAFELPTSYYAVSKQYGNNFFTITVNSDTIVINIQNGNYTQSTIMDYINTQLSNAGVPFSYISFTVNLINDQTGSSQTVVGTNTNAVVNNIELNFQNDRNGISDTNTSLPLKFGWMLGFRNGIYTENLNYISEGIVDIFGPKYFYLVIDDYNNNVSNNFYSAFNSSVLNKNILARISLQAKPFNILEQNNLNIITPPREYFGPINLQTMNIQLLDEYGRIVNLNNMDYSFCLSLTTVYDL